MTVQPVDVSIVSVLHESATVVERCFSSVRVAATDVECEWIVVDCGSTDDAAGRVEARWPDVSVRRMANVGYAAGANAAMAKARGRYVLLVNPDTEWRDGSLAEIIATLDRLPRIAAASVLQRDASGRTQPSIMRDVTVGRQISEALLLHRLPGLAHYQVPVRPPDGYDRCQTADWLVGAVLVVRRTALDAIGLFDKRFFLYCEEVDWCLRARRAGWQIAHLPIASITHAGGGVPSNTFAARHMARSKVRLAHKHFRRREAMAFRLALAGNYAIRTAFVGALGRVRPAARRRAQREAACLREVLRRMDIPVKCQGRGLDELDRKQRRAFEGREP